MYILGINKGHNATAALLKDGKIVGCVSEERFSRIKNHTGFPYKSIEYLLKLEKIKSKNLDSMILTRARGVDVRMKPAQFNMFLINYSNKNLSKKVFSYIAYKYPKLVEPMINLKRKLLDNKKQRKLERSNLNFLSSYFKYDKKKIIYVDHHLLHALSPCFNIKNKTLILTLDGEGLGDDYKNIAATVYTYDGKTLKKLSETEKGASLGYLYGMATLFLGMKPHEHEFKVMGMAPYAKKYNAEKIYNLFKEIMWIDGLKFKTKFRMQYADMYFKDKLGYKRFDNISAGIQKLTEELTAEWVRNAIKKTKINRIALSGGVFMNVKANQKILELPEVKEIFPMPSCGDECNAIGACFFGYMKYCKENNVKFNPKPIKDLYLGPEYSDEEIEAFLKENGYFEKYRVKKLKNIEKEVAKLLARSEIVARFKGRSEWGARALGNRSILANPSSKESIKTLNELIKDRDFWMPFTPSILEEDLHKYIENPKKAACPYMIVTFESTEKARREIPAAMHPYDLTARPQEVKKQWNKDYHKLIKEFKKLTGISAVLNTSFNLHGEPNVLSPKDAIHTLESSELKHLAMGNYLVSKKITS